MQHRLSVYILGLLLAACAVATAQTTRNRVDNRGKEFRLAFLHTNGAEDTPRFYVTVWCTKPTRGVFTYMSSGESFAVDIPTPNVPVQIPLNPSKLILPRPASINSETSKYTLHAMFDDEVTLYGINTQRWSSDAWVALPEEVLGTEYVVISYPNTISPSAGGQLFDQSDFPSQLAVIAYHDATNVTVWPTARLVSRTNTNPFTKLLNAGEILFVQADDKVGLDLTGTRIASDKPIGVYGSHQRTNIPYNEAVGRDHLVEHLLPVNRWTNRPILTPHFQIRKTIPDANIARIVALNDNTEIRVDSVVIRTLNARQFVEIPLDRGMLVTASGPIQVAQYQHSTMDASKARLPNDTIGDPFMMQAFAPEQFDTAYAFESYATRDFFFHFINVVIPTERATSVELDGRQISPNWTRIPKTSYSYAQIAMSAGTHYIRARVPFGLYIYGYGPYNSYGTPGAVVFDTLFKDQKPPLVSVIDSCEGVVGYAYDDSTYDFGVESVRLDSASRNVALSVEPFLAGVDSVRFRVALNDPFNDGQAEMTVVDTAGLDSKVKFPVKGFTVSVAAGGPIPLQLDTLASLNGLQFCTSIRLRNYGGFPQTLTSLNFNSSDPGLTIADQLPITLQPGEERELTLCYQHVGDTAFTASLRIGNGCLQRELALLPLISGIDSTYPVITWDGEPCAPSRSFSLKELGIRNAGIKSIDYITLENADPILNPNNLPTRQTQLTLFLSDTPNDVIYTIVVEDLVGNRVTLSDTIGGATLAVARTNGTELGMRINSPWEYQEAIYGDQQCDSVTLENYGLRRLDLSSLRLFGNLEYSIPPDQLPISLLPGETRRLMVCVRPRGVGQRIDTLVVDFNCGAYSELVELKVNVLPLAGSGADRCGNALTFLVGGFARRNYLMTPFPNPTASSTATVSFGLDANQQVTLVLLDEFGNEKQRMLDNDPMPGGVAQIQMDVTKLPQGLYFLQMQTSSGDVRAQKLVITR